MDSMDNLRERLEALEQRTEHFHQQTRMVDQRLRWWRGLACGVLLVGLVSLPLPAGMATEEHTDKDTKGLAQRLQRLEAQVKALQATLAAVTFDGTTKELVITGANLRIVNGLGKTDCGLVEEPIPDCPNGVGNLIVGYNELRGFDDIRTGSHNVVVGSLHNFSRFGGLVVGQFNTISGAFASVVGGGQDNVASGDFASVVGGSNNTASGFNAVASGGSRNTASGAFASVVGGGAFPGALRQQGNVASGNFASVSGGQGNVASGTSASVSGGGNNVASGGFASVSGGGFNSTTFVGASNTASGELASVCGGSGNTAGGSAAVVSGGMVIKLAVLPPWSAGETPARQQGSLTGWPATSSRMSRDLGGPWGQASALPASADVSSIASDAGSAEHRRELLTCLYLPQSLCVQRSGQALSTSQQCLLWVRIRLPTTDPCAWRGPGCSSPTRPCRRVARKRPLSPHHDLAWIFHKP
jgi:hypothetical protein